MLKKEEDEEDDLLSDLAFLEGPGSGSDCARNVRGDIILYMLYSDCALSVRVIL